MESAFLSLSLEAREFQYGAPIPEMDVANVSPLEFYRLHVASNQPLLIRNACHHWAAIKKWKKTFFCDNYGEKEVVAAVTPNGYADAVAFDEVTNKEYFVMPEERSMKFKEFWQALDNYDEYPGVFYMQRQNSNLTADLPELIEDIESDIPWATEAFGTPPDAVNFWVGDKRAVTSMHKDPYENIYCVVHGYKDFILLPPTDRPWIPYKQYPMADYKENSPGKFSIVPKTSAAKEETDIMVPWISIDPLAPDWKKYPSYKNASPVHIRVNAGDVLYLPSLWYHHVRQSHGCIAVNYWYDMQYDVKYVYFKFLEALVEKEENNFKQFTDEKEGSNVKHISKFERL